MPAERGAGYTLAFAAAVCVTCAVLVSSAAVALRPAQRANRELDMQRNVLGVAGLTAPGERLGRDEVRERFQAVRPVVIDRASGAPVEGGGDAASFDPREAARDPSRSTAAPDNPAQVQRLPDQLLVYEVRGDGGELERVVLPVHGKGLWSTLWGFLALGPDGRTVQGITFYEHAETPGLGGKVDDPAWKARWVGRRALDDDGQPAIRVIKGRAGDAAEAPFEVDGLSGATLTSNGVTALVRFWLGDEGYGPYLARLRAGGGEG